MLLIKHATEVQVNIVEFEHNTALINRQATDLCNLPVVQEGYKLSGHPSSMVFIHLNKMASARLKKHFMLANTADPLYQRVLADLKIIIAEGIKTKYELRKMGKRQYDYLALIDKRVEDYFKSRFHKVQEELGGLLCATTQTYTPG